MIRIGNRRRKRGEYILDVQVQTEGRFRRRSRWLFAVAAVVAVAGLTGLGIYRLVRFTAAKMVYENPRFKITQVVVENAGGVLTAQQVMSAAGVTSKAGFQAAVVAGAQRTSR